MSGGHEGQPGQEDVDGGVGGQAGHRGTAASMHLLQISVGLSILMMFIILVWTALTVQKLDDKRRAAEIATCERGNIVRAKQNEILKALTKAGFRMPPQTALVVCEEIVK